jgi:hypothetical protein
MITCSLQYCAVPSERPVYRRNAPARFWRELGTLYIVLYTVGNADDKSTTPEGLRILYYNNICCDRYVIVG